MRAARSRQAHSPSNSDGMRSPELPATRSPTRVPASAAGSAFGRASSWRSSSGFSPRVTASPTEPPLTPLARKTDPAAQVPSSLSASMIPAVHVAARIPPPLAATSTIGRIRCPSTVTEHRAGSLPSHSSNAAGRSGRSGSAVRSPGTVRTSCRPCTPPQSAASSGTTTSRVISGFARRCSNRKISSG